MASKSKRARMAPIRDLSKSFKYWAIAVFVVKLLIIFNIQGGDIEIATVLGHDAVELVFTKPSDLQVPVERGRTLCITFLG